MRSYFLNLCMQWLVLFLVTPVLELTSGIFISHLILREVLRECITISTSNTTTEENDTI